ncbi:MAG: 3-oxoacyl-ACP reductase FabG [Defluviitaleaceae bacterium]|nr:3-oxoacyl-ACP reductase FabG [Defluviitaleaceae bacterium]
MRIFITGGTKGIGKKAAMHFAQKGYSIAICGSFDKGALQNTLSQLQAIDAEAIGFLGDISDYENVVDMFDKIKKKFGGIDLLVNNAGIAYNGYFADMKPYEWQKIINTNLNGVINCSHTAVNQMLSQGRGVIVNISSIWGNVGASCEAVYSATKGGINAFTKALAKELGSANIRINAVAAGVVNTEMNAFLDDDEEKELINQIPLRRFATPQEIAETIDFIAHSQYITGQIITIDGGLT